MKASELRQYSLQELRQKLEELKKQLFELNFQRQMGNVQKPHLFRAVKKDIARVLTVMKEKEDGQKTKKKDI